jgi:formylglycine-generating enzyme required for sulfatase activity
LDLQQEITQAQWEKVMEATPSAFKGADLPVETVSWVDCVAFCKRLSQVHEGTFRLPTEAEWEHACVLDTVDRRQVEGSIDSFAWYRGNSMDKSHAVGTKSPGALGINDMQGNVAEWCQDNYESYEAGEEIVVDPFGTWNLSDLLLDTKVARGGHYLSSATECAPHYRSYYTKSGSGPFVGLRVLRELK